MDKAKAIEALNVAIALELTGLLQYNQYAQMLMGHDRRLWQDFFKGASDESLAHARKFASKVTALGGVPCAEPHAIRHATDLHDMLQNSLDHERTAVQAYTHALEICESSPAYRTLLEDQILAETEDVEDLEKYLGQVNKIAVHHHRKPMKMAL